MTEEDESRDEDPADNIDDDDDENDMAEDPFEAGFLARRGATSSSISKTLRALSGMMSGTPSRLRRLLESLKRTDEPSVQLIALQELSELLLVSTEDNLAGHFAPDQFVKELVTLMEPNEFGEENPEMMLLACRCIANLMEALPQATGAVVYGGAVPVLLSKLFEIHYMDLAEQALTTLGKISVEFPASILRFGGLTACLTYLDFFATSTQRTAVTIAANCCRSIPEESFTVVKDVMPILLNVLNSNDQRVIEQGCLCVSRIVESFKYHEAKLEELMSTDLLRVVLRLLLPGSTSLISAGIHTQFLRVLSFTARASPTLTVEMLKMNVVDTLYQILTGVSPPSAEDNVAQKIDSVLIMQALIHKPKEQVFETLNVICELLPGLDKNALGVLGELVHQNHASSGFDGLEQVKKSSMQKRVELLSTCKSEIRRFAVILFPTLTDAYSSTVNLSVRQKVLTAQLKMLCNLDTDILEDALRMVPYAAYLASILSQQDHPFLVTAGLQAAELLLQRMEQIYRYQFYREGVIAEIKKLADRPLSSPDSDTVPSHPPLAETVLANATTTIQTMTSELEMVPHVESQPNTMIAPEDDVMSDDEHHEVEQNDEDPDDEASEDSSSSSDHQATSSPAQNIQDAVTHFAQRFISQYENESGRDLRTKSTKFLGELQALVSDIADCYDNGKSEAGARLFRDLARYFEGNALESITSYELLTSKVVVALLDILQHTEGQCNEEARSAFVQAFMGTPIENGIKTSSSNSPVTAFSVLIYKLQDLLSRAEHFEVMTVHQNSSDSSKSSAASMLAKQIRIRLVADEDSGIPRPYRNIMVSIHAIANFKALDDYLRPRISLSERSPPPRNAEADTRALSGAATARAGLNQNNPQFQNDSMTGLISEAANKAGFRASGSKAMLGSKSSQDVSITSAKDHSGRESGHAAAVLPIKPPEIPTPEHNTASQEGSSQDLLECADETALEDDDDDDLDDDTNMDAIMQAMGDLEDVMQDEDKESAPVNMEVAPSGGVTARQEDGTRIATPTRHNGTRTPSSSVSTYAEMARNLLTGQPHRHLSYAAALQAVPQDWHLEFSANGRTLSNETTIYRAVHLNQDSTQHAPMRMWSSVHSVNFKRVQGPSTPSPSGLTPAPEVEGDSDCEMPQSLENNPTAAEILRLLRILHEINSTLEELLTDSVISAKCNPEPLSQFVNTKLTAKLNRQLEEPLIVASNCLPSWSEDLARLYPFLFPFETRHLFLQSTSFGYSRSMARWQNAQSANDSRRDRHRDERPFLGRLQRQKVRISRNKILESAVKVMELYGASPSILEVEYFEEVGTGLGPTLEFYSTVSKEFCKKKLRLWRDNESNRDDEFAFGMRGLFPAPMSDEQSKTENGQKVLMLFKMLGKFVARSMLDSRIIDLSFNPAFFRVPEQISSSLPTLGAVKLVDEDLGKSLHLLKQFVEAKRKIDVQRNLSPLQKAQKVSRIQVAGATVDDLGLDFTLPGYPSIELIPDGADKSVNIDNVAVYITKVIDFTMHVGIRRQVDAFRAGFSQVFPYSTLKTFTPDELVMLFGRVTEDWSIESKYTLDLFL